MHVSKQAGTKGVGALDVLKSLPEQQSPLAAMRAKVNSLSRFKKQLTVVDAATALEPEVRAAVAASHDERQILQRAVKKLLQSETVPSPYVPTGF